MGSWKEQQGQNPAPSAGIGLRTGSHPVFDGRLEHRLTWARGFRRLAGAHGGVGYMLSKLYLRTMTTCGVSRESCRLEICTKAIGTAVSCVQKQWFCFQRAASGGSEPSSRGKGFGSLLSICLAGLRSPKSRLQTTFPPPPPAESPESSFAKLSCELFQSATCSC